MPGDDTIRVFHLPFSFMLPQRVAADRGYFADEGLDVELIERDRTCVTNKYIPAEETLTGDNDVDLYPICKWESLKRTWEFDDGRIVAKGTFADQPYAVFVRPDSDIETPSDLANTAVGVNRRTGQEYTAIRALEEHMDEDEVVIEGHGMPTDRLRALRDGDVAAVTLLDPHITLAEHLGFEKILEFENHMGVVGADGLEGETLDAFMRAYRRAVETINADSSAYRDQYLDMLWKDSEVAPDLFKEIDTEAVREDIEVPEYEMPELADREDLDYHLSWMKQRQLIDDDADIDAIVSPLR
ncbi:ABC transporter substrate-binding protein [Haloplanus ruber]|uniref:ABC transporter substrate-binding protein n=1 Tax=Haloplanus ruber TaxID=869892 RepID=A0ABD6CVG3_9EURY|nr:ABC transporter substrate-binding protein [Haloplanus ruber]